MDSDIAGAVQAAVAAAFAIAGLTKLLDRQSVLPFLLAVHVPFPAAAVIRRALPIAEIAIGLAVISLPGPGAIAVACLVAGGFALMLWQARASRVAVACRCFGSIDATAMTVLQPLRATTLFAAGAGLLAVRLVAGDPRPPDPAAAALVGLLCTVAWLFVFAIAARVATIWDTTRRLAAEYEDDRADTPATLRRR